MFYTMKTVSSFPEENISFFSEKSASSYGQNLTVRILQLRWAMIVLR